MSKAKFILKEPNAKVETLIYLIYNYQYKRFKYSTGEKINPKFWNQGKQRAKETKQFKEHPEFNTRLDKIETGIKNAFRKLLNDGIQPNNTLLKETLENELSDNILKPKKITLFDFTDKFIEECKPIKSHSTIKMYNTANKYLKEYSQRFKPLDFETINLEFYNSYLSFLINEHNLADNTIGKHIKVLKVFLNEATERGYNTNLEFRKKKFKAISEESDTVYLSLDELKKIENLDIRASKRLDKVKDLFLIGCYTGLRFSDFTQIKPENIVSDNTIIKIRTQKTGSRVSIPLNSTVRSILKKYDNHLPKAYTNQTMNSYLKELVGLAGIKEQIQTTITKGGKVVKEVLPKHKLVSTHTARRSFATNLYLSGVPTISIMKITGHRTEKSFLKYIRVTQEENADKLLTHPFFN